MTSVESNSVESNNVESNKVGSNRDSPAPRPADLDMETTWRSLVTAALLGTDRREPPTVPAGPLADVVADTVRADPAMRMLDSVAAVTAARRAAFVPLPPAPPLMAPEPDERPVVSAVASAVAQRSIAAWPILEDEWIIEVVTRGLRLPPELAVDALRRTTNDRLRRVRALVAAGTLGEWLIEQFPALSFRGSPNRDAPGREIEMVDALALPELTMTPELVEMVVLDAHTFVDRLHTELLTRPLVGPDQQMFTNLLARARPAVLIDAADALAAMSIGLAQSLAELARARAAMLDALD